MATPRLTVVFVILGTLLGLLVVERTICSSFQSYGTEENFVELCEIRSRSKGFSKKRQVSDTVLPAP